MSFNATRRGRIALAALFVGLLAACDTVPTQPGAGLGPSLRANTDVPRGQVLGPVAITTQTYQPELWDFPTHLHIPPYSAYYVTLEGTITLVSNPLVVGCFPGHSPPYGQEGAYGPSGIAGFELRLTANRGNIPLSYDASDPNGPAVSAVYWTWDPIDVTIDRKQLYSGIGQNGNGCDPHGFYEYSSNQTAKVTLLETAELTLEPGYSMVKKGTVVRFTGRDQYGNVTGSPNWIFVAADTADDHTSGCGLGGANPCDVTVMNSGQLRMANYINGGMHAASAVVKVYSTFGLTADKSQIAAHDTVTFTPQVDGAAGAAARWRWRGADSSDVADPCAAGTATCLYAPASAGTMWAYTSTGAGGGDSASASVAIGPPPKLQVTGPAVFNSAGDSVTFTASATLPASLSVTRWTFHGAASGRYDITSCGTASVCSLMPIDAGYVVAYALVGGVAQSDSAYTAPEIIHLTVVASPASIPSGSPVLFTAAAEHEPAIVAISGWRFVSDGGTEQSVGCLAQSAESSCVEHIVRSGRMWAFGSVNERPDSAFATVTVTEPDSTGCSSTLRRGATSARRSGVRNASAACTEGAPTLQINCPETLVRGSTVHCVVSMTDGTSFTLTHLRALMGEMTLVDVPMNFTGTSYDWTGEVAASTEVIADGTANGLPLSGTTTFAVTSRTITSEIFPDLVKPARPTAQSAHGQPIMAAAYPGVVSTENGWATLHGGVGRTWHPVPKYTLVLISDGPNKNLIYTTNFVWAGQNLPGIADMVPSGIYISAAFDSNDPFYARQTGENGICGPADVTVFRGEVYEHELLHYTGGIQIHQANRLNRRYEATVARTTAEIGVSESIKKQVALPIGAVFALIDANDDKIDTNSSFSTSLTCQWSFP